MTLAAGQVAPIALDPVLHPALVVVVVLALAGLALAGCRAGAALVWPPGWARLHVGGCAALRLLAVMALAVLLVNPVSTRRAANEFVRPSVHLLVDTSGSMCVNDESDAGEAVARLDRLRQHWLDPALLERLASRTDLRVSLFADGSRPLGAQAAADLLADGAETRLADVLQSAIQNAGPGLGTLVVLTDGRDTTRAPVSPAAEPARARGIAISSVLVGTTARQPDLSVRLAADHAFVHDGQSTTLRGEINQVGLDGQRITAILERDGQIIDRSDLILGPEPARLSFNVTPTGGDSADRTGMVSLCEFRLRVEPQLAESRSDNNESLAFVQVTRQHLRVALFENEPYWDTKYLTRALRDAAEIDLTTIIGLGRREEITRYVSAQGENEPDQPAGAPTTLEELSAFDVVILGRGVERWFPGAAAEQLVAYVSEHGGSLVLARGRPFGDDNPHGVAAMAAIDSIVPVEWGEQKLSGGTLRAARSMAVGDPLSFEGLGDTDLILSHLPGMIAQTHVQRERAASIIWARTETSGEQGALPAAVATQQVGHGRVLAILVDGLWKWALLPPNDADFDPVFPLFWTRAVRWLAGGGELLPGQSIGLSLSRLNVRPGQTVEATVQTRYVDASRFNPALTLIAPDGSQRTLTPNALNESGTRLLATCAPEQEGVYTIRLDAPGMSPPSLTSRFVVHDPSRERLDLSADHAPMIELARATGGKVYDADHPEALLDDLQAEAVAAETEPITQPLWDRPWLLAALMLLLAADWFWRRATSQL